MASPPTVMVCFGTRPEVIKLAPVIARLEADGLLDPLVVTTAQHRQMLDQMLEVFGLTPEVDLDLMRPDQDLAGLTARAVAGLGRVIDDRRPAAVLVQGDTTSALCGALAGFYMDVPVGHVEAGLRTGDPRHPFPEEINRRLVAPLARWHFCPTAEAASNLRREGIDPQSILVSGNTVIDALLATAACPLPHEDAELLPVKRAPFRILVTMHRRETQGERQRELCRMIARLAARPGVEVIFPVHLSPSVRASVMYELAGRDVYLLEPLSYPALVHALTTSDLVLSDSGGIQEEAPSLGVPVFVMRTTTERPEGIAAGCARLVGTDPATIEQQVISLLANPQEHARMARAESPYGDGRAARRIVERLYRDLLPPTGAQSASVEVMAA